jgi:Asp-tRNA(Asn)/Glu-tRNA(Gln) amidotransferase A subunit family amidase
MQTKLSALAAAGLLLMLTPGIARSQIKDFHIEEATIGDIHRAIQRGQVTCKGIVQAYIDRVKAYNGSCTALVTKDGLPIAPASGTMRAGSPVKFPTATVAVSKLLPDFDQYAGLPLEFGRMEPTLSDPSVQEQVGLRVGIPNAGQLNALTTLNIRGERSVTCKGDFDRAPSAGPLPPGAPKACEEFRKLPDALERAAELDKQYGTKPDLEKMPMYCAVFSWKTWYDAKDMRATGGNDVNFAMDAPKLDSPDVADLRAKGAISFAVANASSTGGPSQAAGPNRAKTATLNGGYAYGAWGGQPCNPYDTERVPRGTSSGSGVSVSANLVTCSMCEQTSASCKGPASRNGVANLLLTKGVLGDGGTGYQNSGDRVGIMCRTIGDAALVSDAAKGFDTRDLFTALPKGLVPREPYASFVVKDADVRNKPLKGIRVAIVREFMVKHTKNDVAISDQLDKEIKAVLRDKLGADLVESVDPMYADDPTVPNMKYTFRDAFAEILPHNMPEYFFQTTRTGELEFAVPGWDVRTVKYQLALALGKAPLSDKINLRRISSGLANPRGAFQIDKYLAIRGDERVKDWASWVANAKFKSDGERANALNAVAADNQDPRAAADGINYLKMQTVFRMVVQKVMAENGIDAFVNPENTLPPYKIGGPEEPAANMRPAISCCTAFTALLGGPEAEVPAGFVQTVYEPRYVLSADKTRYEEVTGTVQSMLPHPMPISMMFWAAPGSDAAVIKTASAYEAATHHRAPPSAFGPLSQPSHTTR